MVCYRDSRFFYIPLKSADFFHFGRQLTWLNKLLNSFFWNGMAAEISVPLL